MPDEPEVAPVVGPVSPRNGAPRDRNLRRAVRRWWRHHNSAVLIGAVVALLVGGTLTAVLATRHLGDVAVPDLPAAVSSSPAVVPVRTAAPVVVPVSTAKGTVIAVVAPGRWTFAVEQGLQVTVVALPTTVYSSGRTATDVAKGSMLTVTGTFVSGVITAKSVTFTKKKKEKKSS